MNFLAFSKKNERLKKTGFFGCFAHLFGLMPRRGIIMYLAMFVLMVLAILAFQFRQTASHARSMAFHFELDEAVRQIAESAANEAFMKIYAEVQTSVRSLQSDFSILIPLHIPLTFR